MRIAFFCKRHYTGKDVMLDQYGRLYELPYQLARLGHEVHAFCLDYRGHGENGVWEHPTESGTLIWTSHACAGIRALGLAGYPRRLLRQLAVCQPDLLLGASDIPHVVLATWLARRMKLPCVVDLYDNFESFGQARIPGFRRLLARAARQASLVIAVGHALKTKVLKDYGATCPVWVMPNGVNTAAFCPGDPLHARQALSLPAKAKLIGTAGALSRTKGLGTVYQAWRKIEAAQPDVHLVLAGPVESGFPPPAGPRVHYLGELSQAPLVDLYRALDVGIIPIEDSPFGRYCFPQKAYEMLACRLPVVVTDIGEMSTLFAEMPQARYNPSDTDGLVAAVARQLDAPAVLDAPVLDWQALVAQLAPLLEQIAKI